MEWIISIICIALLIAIAVVLIESRRECRRFRVTRYSFNTPKLSEGFGSFKVAMIADLHNTVFGDANNEILKTIGDFNPDAIILAGDMIVCHADEEKGNAVTAEFINKLSEYSKVYYGIGNHEKGAKALTHKVGDLWNKYYDELIIDDNRIVFMDNKSIAIHMAGSDSVIRLYGLDLDRDYYKRFIAKKLNRDIMNGLLGNINHDEYNILIAHNPDYFKTYSAWGADLVFSGHNHGGLVRIPYIGGVISPRLRLFPRYDYGLYKDADSTMVLTNGMGAHSLKIRVGNIPEIVLIEIND